MRLYAQFVLQLSKTLFFYGEPINPACANCDDSFAESSETKVETELEDQQADVNYESEYEYVQDSFSYSHSFNMEIWGLEQNDDLNFEEPPAAAGN